MKDNLTTRIKSPFFLPPVKKKEPHAPLNFGNHEIPNWRISVEEYYAPIINENMVMVNISFLRVVAEVKPRATNFWLAKGYKSYLGKEKISRVYPIKKEVLNDIFDVIQCPVFLREKALQFETPFVLGQKYWIEIKTLDDYNTKLRTLDWAFIDWFVNKIIA